MNTQEESVGEVGLVLSVETSVLFLESDWMDESLAASTTRTTRMDVVAGDQLPVVDDDDDDDDDGDTSENDSVSGTTFTERGNCFAKTNGGDVDDDAVSLLQQIFPHETVDSLLQLHANRCSAISNNVNIIRNLSPTTLVHQIKAAPCIDHQSDHRRETHTIRPLVRRQVPTMILPPHFLRLPFDVAVRRELSENEPGSTCSKYRYELVEDLTQRAVSQHERRYSKHCLAADRDCGYYCISKVVYRNHITGGLGMTLVADENGFVGVHALVGLDDRHEEWTFANEEGGGEVSFGGPALSAGVQCGDVLIGIDGVAFTESMPPNEKSLVHHAVSRCRSGPDPVVLHLLRRRNLREREQTPPAVVSMKLSTSTTPSLFDTSDTASEDSFSVSPTMGDTSFHSDLSDAPTMIQVDHLERNVEHPFVKVLASAHLIQSRSEMLATSKALRIMNERSRQWDDLVAFVVPSSDIEMSLVGVRNALSVRIVNSFDDGDDTAYTIWVYDAELGQEWYAPLRYHRDFEDLRSATLPLCPTTIKQIPFPSSSSTNRSALHMFRGTSKPETNLQRETKCRQLEVFLRFLCAMIYREKLHPYMVEIAIHVQSFLGCDDHHDGHGVTSVPTTVNATHECIDEPHQLFVRQQLKRCIQRYTFRLFLLPPVRKTVEKFVDIVRRKGPRWEDIETLESLGRDVLKERAMAEMTRIQVFLDQLQDMIIAGGIGDFMRIAERPQYEAIHSLIRLSTGGANYWEVLVREAVREQVEVEVYVPLRSVISRWLVHGWRHEDIEVHFRMKELSGRSQEFFRMDDVAMRYDWSSVSEILYNGVGLSTLPCVKLRAIVDAAREIFRIVSQEQGTPYPPLVGGDKQTNSIERSVSPRALGADEFLPIFIFCVVQAEIERACALCVLLRTLCDRSNKIGEIGYYLLSFEAAITHCEEVDLSDNTEEMPSFLSIPLDD